MSDNEANMRYNDQDDDADDSKIFPQRLMEILSDEDSQDSISWLPHGRAFVVKNRKLFSEKVMPKYFSRKAKFSSFTRKLNRWNFVRVSSGPELGAYYHEFFLRDKPQLAAQMFCKNARSKLAMAAEAAPHHLSLSSGPEPPSRQLAAMTVAAAAASQPRPSEPLDLPIPSSLLAALCDKLPNTGNWSNLQMLQRQMELFQMQQVQQLEHLQRERAKRILMEQAVGLSESTPPQNGYSIPPMVGANGMVHRTAPAVVPSSVTSQQQARLEQMRQLLEQRNQQREENTPTNHRASAA